MSDMSLEEMAEKLRDAGYIVQPPPVHCCRCSLPARWARQTHYTEDQLFCQKHAELEEDFGSDAHGITWLEIYSLGL